MLGALIGDLAAWTWQHDKALFYQQLIAGEAPISEYGGAILAMAKPVFERQPIDRQTIGSMLYHYFKEGVDVSQDVNEWMGSGMRSVPYNKVRLVVTMINALVGWVADTAEDAMKMAREITGNLDLDKEDMYAAISLSGLIWNLRHGMSKDEAIKALDFVGDVVIDWENKRDDGPLGGIARAWDAFYRAFDFTSTIHSAVKSPVNPRLTAAIAGEFAEAMYGCEMGFLKKKYTDCVFFWIEFPNKIQRHYEKELIFIREHTKRFFFPKNSARTNVERHRWISVKSEFDGKEITRKFHQILLKAFYTDWEHRYGVYWENGWFYVYRSFVLICRFKVELQNKDVYKIVHVQESDEKKDSHLAMCEVFGALMEFYNRQYDNE